MTTWRDEAFVVVDVETTGLDPDKHEVLSIGIVRIEAGRIKVGSVFYRELRPANDPAPDTIVIHGITPSRAAASEDPAEVAGLVVRELGAATLVAHVAAIERSFLARWLAPHGWTPPRTVIDTDVLARRWLADERRLRMHRHVGLGAAAGLFGLPEEHRHHALGDALTTAQLFLALASRLGGGSLSARTLARLRPATPLRRLPNRTRHRAPAETMSPDGV